MRKTRSMSNMKKVSRPKGGMKVKISRVDKSERKEMVQEDEDKNVFGMSREQKFSDLL